jgi:hypothetical protein
MKEHPLLFTNDMVRAILDDRKTQTRRVPVERYRNWKVGDLIWVREAWCYAKMSGYDARDDGGEIWYRATDLGICEGTWKPSIHMFRKFARIFLEITGLRVERAQEINEKDTKAEGVIIRNIGETYWRAFRTLWDSINAKRHGGIYAWDKNPEVKVIEFKRKG